MKCYTWLRGKLTSGIQVEAHRTFGTIVSLGDEGTGGGRYHEKVEIYPENPPEIENRFIYNAHPVKITTDLKLNPYYYVLAKPPDTDADPRMLVRINTRWIYSRGTHGLWKSLAGAPANLMVGYGAHGTGVQRAATWRDGLVLLAPGDVVCVTPTGSVLKMEEYVLIYDEDSIHHTTFSDYESQIADKPVT